MIERITHDKRHVVYFNDIAVVELSGIDSLNSGNSSELLYTNDNGHGLINVILK